VHVLKFNIVAIDQIQVCLLVFTVRSPGVCPILLIYNVITITCTFIQLASCTDYIFHRFVVARGEVVYVLFY